MLMELCISELEDVSREPQLNETPQPVIQESPHPYPDDVTISNTVRMPNAEALVITFDSRYVTFDPRYVTFNPRYVVECIRMCVDVYSNANICSSTSARYLCSPNSPRLMYPH